VIPQESFDVLLRVIPAKIVEEQKRIKELSIAEPESGFEMDAGTFKRRPAPDVLLDCSALGHP